MDKSQGHSRINLEVQSPTRLPAFSDLSTVLAADIKARARQLRKAYPWISAGCKMNARAGRAGPKGIPGWEGAYF